MDEAHTGTTVESAPPGAGDRPRPVLLDRLRVLQYAVESKAPTYRAIMRVFADAKARYVLQMGPEEVAGELRAGGYVVELSEEGGIEAALDTLVEWGNLKRSQDTRRAATLEEFRRRNSVYQTTTAGEAAERAVAELTEAMQRAGSLQTVMLAAILSNLRTLADELAGPEPSPARLFTALFDLDNQFSALTANASTFMGGLYRAIEASEVHAEAFVAYKQAVIAYLEQFLSELARLAPQIADAVAEVERLGVERMAAVAAVADEAPALEQSRDGAQVLRRKWEGLRAWFIPDDHGPATVDLLRGAARDAIVRILSLLERINEKRFRRVNRTADLLRLAQWFSEPEGPAAAHRLFQGAFALGSARHLGVPDPDPDRADPQTSWWDAPPVAVAPQLRRSGHNTRLGAPGRIEDNSAARSLLKEQLRREREQAEAALARLAARGSFRVSDLVFLDETEFGLFLALVDRTLSSQRGHRGRRRARSRDGRLTVTLVPPPDRSLAVVSTPRGRLSTLDYSIEIAGAFRAGPPAREPATVMG